jgi:transcriptional regulator with XRE-family HTH domain
MATKGRVWSEFDISMMRIFHSLREDRELSFRRLGEMTGLNHTRIMDMEKNRNGTPTLTEFLTLCEVFGLDAPGTLEQLIEEAKNIRKEQVKKKIAQTESDAEDMIKSFSEGDQKTLGLAADVEKEKWLEARGGDGR